FIDAWLVESDDFRSLSMVVVDRRSEFFRFSRQREIEIHFIRLIEKRIELVELFLRDWVELVVVATGAADRQSEPADADHLRPIDDLFDAILFQVGPPFAIAERVPQEAGGEELLLGWIRQEIARELFDRELIERQIAVEGIDHPLPVAPRDGAQLVSEI